MKLMKVSSVIDWRSTSGRRLSRWSTGVVWAALGISLSIQLATRRNWCSPPMALIEGNRRTFFNWSMFNFNVNSRGMSVDSSGRQARMSVEQLVDWAKPQIPLTLSRQSLQCKVERLNRFLLQGTPICHCNLGMRNWMHVCISFLHSRLWANR